VKSTRFVRAAGVAGMFGSALWVLALYIEYAYDLLQPRESVLYAANQAMFLVGMLCFLAVIAGLMRAGAGGRFGKISLGIFFFGWAMFAVAVLLDVIGISVISDSPIADLVILIGAVTSTLGGFLAGIAVAVSGRLPGLWRFAPLSQGLYQIAAFLRVVLFGQEPTQLTESLWMATWFLIGLALLVAASDETPADRKEAPVEA
jgi:hypothetical protein